MCWLVSAVCGVNSKSAQRRGPVQTPESVCMEEKGGLRTSQKRVGEWGWGWLVNHLRRVGEGRAGGRC